MPIDWRQILELAPLALAKPGSPQSAAMLEGFLRSKQRLAQEQQQQQQFAGQEQLRQAQLQNIQADNARADESARRQQEQAALQRLSQGLGAFTPAIDQAADTYADPIQAENALKQRSSAVGSAFGLDPSALSGFIPPMAPLISAKKKKRAQDLYERAEKIYGPEAMAGDSITLQTGEMFGDIKPSALRAIFSVPAVTTAGAPAPPYVKPAHVSNPGTFEEYVGLPPEQQAVRRDQRKAWMQADDRPHAGPVTKYQQKEVLNDEGVAVTANYDSVTGITTDADGKRITRPRPVPSGQVQLDAKKFEKARPVLSAIAELSERINTMKGVVAKMRGAAEKAKAQLNLNDDVAEYEALVSGFTPMVARALGHTGVLTQQDVDSVKALFPRPGDSKTLRDRKVGRMLSIIGQLEHPTPTSAAPGGADDPMGLR